jgi:hypothetical protein
MFVRKTASFPSFSRRHFDEAPPNLTEQKVNEIVDGALKRMQEKVLPGILGSMLKPFQDQFATVADNIKAIGDKVNGPAPITPPAPGADDKTVSPAVKAELDRLARENASLVKRFEDGEKARKEAEDRARNTDKESKIRTSLQGFKFIDSEAAEDAYNIVATKTNFDDNGQLLADGMFLSDFVKSFIPEKKSYLLEPEGKGGAGASGGNTREKSKPFSLEQINPKMSAEDKKNAAAAIVAQLRN